ncbi:MAG: anti-sigma regulatory factor [Oscillospiraceae bacterium]|nr:anti-sigma regulatory factor [Oscillospiraceae bacterium]
MILKFDIPGDDFTRAGEASSAIKNKLKQTGFSPEVVRKVSIAVYEAEINSIIHANGGTITLTADEEAIVAVIADTGKGIPDIEAAMREGFTTACDNIRKLGFGAGMGLPNMRKYTDEFDIQSKVGKGTTVTMKIYNKQE